MCNSKEHGGKRCKLGRPTQADRAASYAASKQTNQPENEVQRVITHLYRAERAENTDAQQLLSEDAKMAFITEQEQETQKMNISPSAKRTTLRRWMRAKFESLSRGKERSLKRVLQVTTGVGMVALMTACGSANPYTPQDAPSASQSATQAAGEPTATETPAETPATETPAVAATVAPLEDGYLTGTWADYQGRVEIGADIMETWGQERSDKAVNFALTALTDLYADDVYGPEAKSQNDFLTARDYLTPEAYNTLSNSVAAGIAGDGEAASLVNSLYPQSNFSGEQTMSDNGTKLLTVTPGAVDTRLTNVSVGKWDVAEGQESMLTVKAYLTITYSGTAPDGSAGTVVQERVQSINLVPAADSWQIASWGHTGTLVK